MMVEDVTITEEEVQVEVLEAEVQLSRREGSFAQRVQGSGGFRSDRSQLQREGGFGPRSSSAPRRKVVLHQTDQEQKVHLIEHQDVLKALVTHKTKKTKKRLTFS
jgi:hypothetical protein